MPVLVEATSVIIKRTSVQSKIDGGQVFLAKIIPNQTVCADDYLVRVGFMTGPALHEFVVALEAAGLNCLVDGMATDFAIVDQDQRPHAPCNWLEVTTVSIGELDTPITAARLLGDTSTEISLPQGWKPNIMSHEKSETLGYLRTENGNDVFLDTTTGKELFTPSTRKTEH